MRKAGLLQQDYILPAGTFDPGIYIIRAFGEDDREYLTKLIVH